MNRVVYDIRFAVTSILLLSIVTVGYSAEPRGYTARPCGFDMNRNGVIGEPGDAHVGDGVTTDPDGDGVNEDILYVDHRAIRTEPFNTPWIGRTAPAMARKTSFASPESFGKR